MAGQTLRKLIVSVSAETGAYQREMARAGRMGQSYFRTITSGNRQAADGWRSQQAAINAQNSAVSSLTQSVSGYAAVMVGALAVGNLIQQADAWNSINARLKLATSSTAEFKEAQQALFDISQRTTTSFSDNANLYTRSSRSLKEYGFSTQESIKFTEALATSFQLSGSSAEEVTSVTTQLSQALAKGVLRGQDFNSVSQSGGRAMMALADGLGVTTGALKDMADKGLLTTDKLVPAIVGQLTKLREEYSKMPPTISGSMQVMSNAFQAWVGGADSATGSTVLFSKAIVFMADNIGLLALTGAAAAIGALTGKSLLAARGALAHAASLIKVRSESIGVARATYVVADSQVIYAKAQLAAAQATVAAATGMKRLSLVQSELVPKQVAVTAAINAQTIAQNNLNKAMALTSGRALLGILGGPAGLAITAATVGASFYLMRDGAADATVSMDSLSLSVEEYGKTWAQASKEQRRALLVDAKAQLGQVQQDLNSAITEIEKGFYDRGAPKGKLFTSIINQLGELRKAAENGSGIDSIVQSLLEGVPAGNSFRRAIEKSAGAVSDQVGNLNSLNSRIGEFTPLVDAATTSASGFGRALNGALTDETVKAWEKRIDALKEKTAKLKDPTELGAITRAGLNQGFDKTPEGQALLLRGQLEAKAADAYEKTKKSQEEASRKAKQAADDSARQAKQLEDNYSRTLRTLHEQADVHATKTELAKIEFETSKGTLSALDAAKKVDLQRAAIAVDNLNTQKSYKDLMGDVQRQEDSLLATTRKRFAELAKLNAQGGLTSDQYREGADAISKSSVGKNTSPTFTGLDASVGGPGGELIKVAEADKALAKWHEKELQRQKELHDQKLITEQQYLDRKFEINEENNKKLESIQDAYKLGSIAVFADLTSNAADMMKQMAGEGSAAYKVLFLASKAAAIAQTMVSTEVAAAKALELGPIMGIPAASLIRGLGYASVGMIAATAVAGFSEGGYTGAGGKFEPKGVVHGGEVVIRKEVVDQPGMKDYLIGLNRSGKPGYASGGFVGSHAMSPAFTAPTVAVGVGGGAAPQINLHINSDGSGGSVSAPDAYEQMGLALLATARAEMPNIARSVIQKEKGQNGLLDPNNRRNS
ncbi:tape measure protein [Pseudomonas weihenstephanensis]|uniref:Tape measure protein n=1 Tax=Pseudomonas weihenstephanensis TaxID=1608994 RepID=A0ABS1ZGE4_9PSED|nr:tape measure protein [Pseudomonas weihenstephanensis]MBM1195539.1 tape measure protein [Pseudomonas weihenstephanensis]